MKREIGLCDIIVDHMQTDTCRLLTILSVLGLNRCFGLYDDVIDDVTGVDLKLIPGQAHNCLTDTKREGI